MLHLVHLIVSRFRLSMGSLVRNSSLVLFFLLSNLYLLDCFLHLVLSVDDGQFDKMLNNTHM